jgi:hypothetical protein
MHEPVTVLIDPAAVDGGDVDSAAADSTTVGTSVGDPAADEGRDAHPANTTAVSTIPSIADSPDRSNRCPSSMLAADRRVERVCSHRSWDVSQDGDGCMLGTTPAVTVVGGAGRSDGRSW